MLLSHNAADWMVAAGSVAAVIVGAGTYLQLQSQSINYATIASLIVAVAGLVTAVAGLINSSLARILPFWQIYVQERRSEQQASDERFHLASKVHELEERLAKYEGVIAKVESQSGESQWKAIQAVLIERIAEIEDRGIVLSQETRKQVSEIRAQLGLADR